jgi:BMFP domain-containing protein YqiC
MNEQSERPQLDELARQMAEAVPKNLRALGEDLEKNFKSLLNAGFERMDLVTREEFDIQAAVLKRTREKLEALEARLNEIEEALADRS